MNNMPAGMKGHRIAVKPRPCTLFVVVDYRCGPYAWPYTIEDLKAVGGFSGQVFATSSALYQIKCGVFNCHPLEDGKYT